MCVCVCVCVRVCWVNSWLFSSLISLPPCLYFGKKKKLLFLSSSNSLTISPTSFHFLSLSLSPPPFLLLALPPTHAYIGMEMRESCILAANIQIQSIRPHKIKKNKKRLASCQPLKLLKRKWLQICFTQGSCFIFWNKVFLRENQEHLLVALILLQTVMLSISSSSFFWVLSYFVFYFIFTILFAGIEDREFTHGR